MSTLQPSFITAAMICLVYLYLWVREGDRYLAIWAAAFGLWTVRYGYGMVAAQATYIDGAVLLPLLALGRATFILWGALTLHGRSLPRWWWAVLGVDVTYLLLVAFAGVPPFVAEGFTHYTLFGVSTIAAGVLFVRAPGLQSGELVIAGAFLAALGALNLLFPFVGTFTDGTVELLYGMTATVQLGIGLSTLLVYMQMSRVERAQLHEQLEGQLTQVLSGYLPICAHCKSIKEDENQWSQIEAYVSERSDAEFSHSICPTCYNRHYADEFGPM